jgi:metal-sulfur cluster biosynthetic enzyme
VFAFNTTAGHPTARRVTVTETEVREALRDVVDPELGVNIVDLGLVYGIQIDGADVRITMTMTSPACPLRDYIQDQVLAAVRDGLPEVRNVVVDIVTDPPWTAELMSEAARQHLQ